MGSQLTIPRHYHCTTHASKPTAPDIPKLTIFRNILFFLLLHNCLSPWPPINIFCMSTAVSCWNINSCMTTKVKQHRTWSMSRWVITLEHQLVFAGGVIDNGPGIVNQSVVFQFLLCMLYWLTRKYPWKGYGPTSSPPSYGLISMTCITRALL